MARPPNDKRPDPTPETAQRTQELFESLCGTCRPHVEAVVRAQCTNEFGKPSISEDDVKMIKTALRAHLIDMGLSPEDADEAIKNAEPTIREPKNIPPEEIDQVVDQVTAEETGLLVSNWINILADARMLPSSGNTIIDLYGLDDAMLPALDADQRDLLEILCMQGVLSTAEMREVLRQVKAALPAGAALPEDLVKFFENEGTFVIQ